ncbi:MAG TPA: hypothetical protein VJ508_04645, partial [Saprospiraceae bacterium]|nr:hypothetical protein [Saprospiraceae bacterium]
MSKLQGYLYIAGLMIILSSCQQEYTPINPTGGPKYVVEGYVEAGENPFPPYVIFTHTLEFNGKLGPDDFTASFVHDATVLVSDGSKEIRFTEVCLSELDPQIRKEVAAQFGFNADSLAIDFCVYADLLNELQAQVGKTYQLRIYTGTDSLSA